MWISGVSDDFREEWGENGSQVSDLENHQDGGGGTRKEFSSGLWSLQIQDMGRWGWGT